MQKVKRRVMPSNIITVLLLVLAISAASFFLVNSSYFVVGSVVVEGNKYIALDDIYRIASIPDKINIFRLRTTEIKKRLTQDLRIDDATVVRQFPGTIVITVKESKPVAYIANSYGFLQLDRQGVILAVFKNLKQVSVPMITGFKVENGYVGDKVEDPSLKNMLEYLSLLDEETLNQLSEVNIQVADQIVVYTSNSVHINLGNTERLEAKAKLTCDILQEITKKKVAVDYIDLTYAAPFIKIKQ